MRRSGVCNRSSVPGRDASSPICNAQLLGPVLVPSSHHALFGPRPAAGVWLSPPPATSSVKPTREPLLQGRGLHDSQAEPHGTRCKSHGRILEGPPDLHRLFCSVFCTPSPQSCIAVVVTPLSFLYASSACIPPARLRRLPPVALLAKNMAR
jgi:hypothetical protein